MPCGSRALLTAYVVYQAIAFAEREVLLAALADAGYRVETAPAGTEASNPLPVLDASRRVVGKAALVVRRDQLPAAIGDLGFVLRDGAYAPILATGRTSERLLERLRAADAPRRRSLRRQRDSASSAAFTAAWQPTAGSRSGFGSRSGRGRVHHHRFSRRRARRSL
jgi:hypothetical protein